MQGLVVMSLDLTSWEWMACQVCYQLNLAIINASVLFCLLNMLNEFDVEPFPDALCAQLMHHDA
jgi:hypothetical protein